MPVSTALHVHIHLPGYAVHVQYLSNRPQVSMVSYKLINHAGCW